MVQIKAHLLPPTPLIPNSKFPLMHYSDFLTSEDLYPHKLYDRFKSNGWDAQWLVAYGPNQAAHYHSATHECMIILSGTAQIRFGTADTSKADEANRHGDGMEPGGLTVEAKRGDAFVIPAGVSHKVFDTPEGSTFRILSPGKARGIEADDPIQALKEVESNMKGFVMFGGYPYGGVWDHNEGGEHQNNYNEVWGVPKPTLDPFVGSSQSGLVGHW